MNKYGREEGFQEFLDDVTRPMQDVADAHRESQGSKEEVLRSDLGTLANWLYKAGLGLMTTGLVLELLPEYTDKLAHSAVAGGIGAVAVGGFVSISDRF
jgi:hypothetical protein